MEICVYKCCVVSWNTDECVIYICVHYQYEWVISYTSRVEILIIFKWKMYISHVNISRILLHRTRAYVLQPSYQHVPSRSCTKN